MNENCKQFYDKSYSYNGLDAQRKYPNEEFCRFMGRNFFQEPVSGRRNINILEVGCGSGANLWLLVKGGFETYGIDLSSESIKLVPHMLNNMLAMRERLFKFTLKLPGYDTYFIRRMYF